MPKTALTALLPFALLLASCGGGPSAPAASAPTTVSSSAAGGGQSTAPSGGAGDQTMSAQEAQILAEVNVARAQARSCGDRPSAPRPP
ncbi:hypothetical protein [Deinococcus multiflagellatus]|uniref:Uncharacterized protein n=1 Tax=Deinococcus multiflagellatus TaxID=1656887 RepID=A0ABW1ZL47_9DEIO